MEKGFTIIEIVIAMLILAIGVVGVFSAFYVIVYLSADSIDRFTATYLSQEGIEVMRNIRDTNWLNSGGASTSWNQFLGTDDVFDYVYYEADYTTAPILNDGARILREWTGSGDYFNVDTNGFYSYRSCQDSSKNCPTKFKRKIIIKRIGDNIVKVYSRVSWDRKANILGAGLPACNSDVNCPCNPANCVQMEEILYNWY